MRGALLEFRCSIQTVLQVLSALEGGNGASEGPYGLGASHYRRPVHVYGLTVSLSIMVDHIEHHRRNVSSAIML